MSSDHSKTIKGSDSIISTSAPMMIGAGVGLILSRAISPEERNKWGISLLILGGSALAFLAVSEVHRRMRATSESEVDRKIRTFRNTPTEVMEFS